MTTRSTDSQNTPLESARERLGFALAKLNQGAQVSKELMAAAKDNVREKTALNERIGQLEADNLNLHEQVASFTLDESSHQINEEALATLTQDYADLQSKHSELRELNISLQQTLDASVDDSQTPSQEDVAVVEAENRDLKEQIVQLEQDKIAMTHRLDDTIAKLEILLEA